jgi:hypothetical protein
MKRREVECTTKLVFTATFVTAFLINWIYLGANTIVGIQIVELSGSSQENIPVTFGQPFALGDVPIGFTLAAREVGGNEIPLQIDAKARHADGSLRHAILTAIIPRLQANGSARIELIATPGHPEPTPITPEALLTTAYNVSVILNVGGTSYIASARDILQSASAAGIVKSWLSGPMASEWLIMSPLKSLNGDPHPHLTARFNIRAYAGMERVRTEVIIENNWAYEPNPSGFDYDVFVSVENTVVYVKRGLKHTHHARWRKIFWWGTEPAVHTKHDLEYLIATRAVPNYDQHVIVSPSALAGMETSFEPMSNGDLTSYMPTTGAHDDIGPLPRWAALYLLTMESRAKANTLANGDAGGSYQIHYRDKFTDLPVSLKDYPYMTLLGNDTDAINPNTGKSEAFPQVTNGLEQHSPDDAHQPSIAYLPYVITGEYYYLEELQFWANYNMILPAPTYRELEKGLLKWGQVRAQAWSLRTLGHAAYITPDDHSLKQYFVDRVEYNLEWYNTAYVNNPNANKLGWLENGYALAYGAYGIAPWQDDFFTWSVAQSADLGFAEAQRLLEWKTKFVVGRLVGPGYCWLNATPYSLQVGTAEGVKYATFAQAYSANFGQTPCSGYEMDGYPDSPTGYGANMQPALAVAVDARAPHAFDAWARYQTRSPKQDYSSSPQFAVIPRDAGNPGSVEDAGTSAEAMSHFELRQNYPNPLNPETAIDYSLPRSGYVTLKIFTLRGEEVATLVSEELPAGRHTLKWNAKGLPSGMYFFRLSIYFSGTTQPSLVATKKLLLVK